MPKYLIEASYTEEGAKGLMKEGAAARRAEVQRMVENLDGHLDAFYFVFGQNDVRVLLDLPGNVTAAVVSLAVMSTGAVRMKTTVLLTPEELDEAVKTRVDYHPPGGPSKDES
jgi:uncharacterized protein with GYD domain